MLRNQNSWEKSIVLLVSKDPKITNFGTGFIIHQNQSHTYVLTCTHVVKNLGGLEKIRQLRNSSEALMVSGESEGIDLSVLIFEKFVDTIPLTLNLTSQKNVAFIIPGFQRAHGSEDFLIRTIKGNLGEQIGWESKKRNFRIQGWDLQITDDHSLEPSYRGAPVIDTQSQEVLGILVQGEGKKGSAISVESLKYLSEMPFDVSQKAGFLKFSSYISNTQFKENVVVHSPKAVSSDLYERINQLLKYMKPKQRLKDAIGAQIDSLLAVDDGLLFLRSDLRTGWRFGQIDLVFCAAELPPDIRQIAYMHRSELYPPNKTKYMIVSINPSLTDTINSSVALKIHLAPISYFEIHGVELGLDRAYQAAGQQAISLRRKFFKDHALFTSKNRLPNKIVIHILVVTQDEKIILMQRSNFVKFQNDHWCATFEEQMQGDFWNEATGNLEPGDEDFFATAVRGIYEELGVTVKKESITFLGICSEYENLAFDVIGLTKIDISLEDVILLWKLKAPDTAEHSRIIGLPFQDEYIFPLLTKDTVYLPEYEIYNEPWHPTSRIRILLGYLYSSYQVNYENGIQANV